MSKSKGLWLGPWSRRLDPPVDLDWTSVKIKVLGVYIVLGMLLILVIQALALSRVRYVASLDRLISFGYSHDHHCFCGPVNETPSYLFFGCALASSLLF